MFRILIATLALVGTLFLVGCGPSKCQQAGGEDVIDYYQPMTYTMPNGNGGYQTITQMIPIFKCELPR